MRGLEWGHLPWVFVSWGGGCLDYCCLGLGCLHGECTFLNIVGVWGLDMCGPGRGLETFLLHCTCMRTYHGGDMHLVVVPPM